MVMLADRAVNAFVRLREANKGQGYTEYIVLFALIAIAVYGAVKLLGTNVSTAINGVAGSV